MNFNRVFHYKPSILGYPYFWKHPYEDCLNLTFFYIKGFWDGVLGCHLSGGMVATFLNTALIGWVGMKGDC